MQDTINEINDIYHKKRGVYHALKTTKGIFK